MKDYPRCKTCKWYECLRFGGKCHRLSIWDYTTICLSGENPAGYTMTGFAWTEESFGCIHHEPKESE